MFVILRSHDGQNAVAVRPGVIVSTNKQVFPGFFLVSKRRALCLVFITTILN